MIHVPFRSVPFRSVPFRSVIIVASACLTLLAYTQSAPSAQAAGPNPQGIVVASNSVSPGVATSAQWLAEKNAYRIISGVKRNQPKGTAAQMQILATPAVLRPMPSQSASSLAPNSVGGCSGATPPCSDVLSTTAEKYIYEPGDGRSGHSNFGSGTSNSDDATNPTHYYSDLNFVILCGPGAADVALYYWPKPPNWVNEANVVDPRTGTSTTWNGQDIDGIVRERGYMAYLAFMMKASGWSQPGLLQQYAPGGTRLQELEVALNWEETGRTSNVGFYALVWHYDATKNPNGATESVFHSEVIDDIYYSNVPVVAEVNAQLLPNWSNSGGQTLHFITIVGYNDTAIAPDGTMGEYYYTDTCGHTTGCGSKNDGGVNIASQSQMWNAIMGAPYNQSTGDGGWIW